MELKRITVDDTEVFDYIADDVFDEPIHPSRLRDYLADASHLMMLAIDDGLVVGQCAAVVHRHPDKVAELYIDEVGTATSHLRQGIARRLMDAIFEWGRELGCEESWLGTELDNVAANGLYQAMDSDPEPIVLYCFGL